MDQKFVELVADQFLYGGVKYASTSVKEATDELVDDFGWNWLIGTQAKYVKRYRNTRREKDLLKIACYQYINWLKLGYHLSSLGVAAMQYTTVDVKATHFPNFTKQLSTWTIDYDREWALDLMYELLLSLKRPESPETLFHLLHLHFY